MTYSSVILCSESPKSAFQKNIFIPARFNAGGYRYPTLTMPCHQRGAALIVALILLLLMSILGVSSVRTTIMEEKMTTTSYDRSLAFQAAEAALRAGEAIALAQSTTSPKNSGFPNNGVYTNANGNCETSPCNGGLCAQPDPDCTSRWLDASFAGWTQASQVDAMAGTPEYFVEYLGNNFPCTPGDINSSANCSHYRVTARSQPGVGRASVMLQSIFLTN